VTKIDFYILTENSRANRHQLVCRLVEKAYGNGHRICIYTESQGEASQIDELLWTYREQSFLPHALYNKADHALTPILIANGLQQTDEHDVLINLAPTAPAFFSQFERLLEPVDNNPEQRDSSRQRYRYYRDCGYPLNSHEIAI
jgi:DNA polymerase-3 subunit chi